MSETPTNGTRWQLQNLDERLAKLEAKLEAYNLAELIFRMTALERRVDSMTKAAWSVAGAIVIAAITFALSIASGQVG